MRDDKVREKKVFEIEYEYPFSVSADWLMRLFNNPKVKIKELNITQELNK